MHPQTERQTRCYANDHGGKRIHNRANRVTDTIDAIMTKRWQSDGPARLPKKGMSPSMHECLRGETLNGESNAMYLNARLLHRITQMFAVHATVGFFARSGFDHADMCMFMRTLCRQPDASTFSYSRWRSHKVLDIPMLINVLMPPLPRLA